MAQPNLPPEFDGCFLPGLVDLQINGCAGAHFGDPELSAERCDETIRLLWRRGVTRLLPTLITDDAERMVGALTNLARLAGRKGTGKSIVGFHLEGPFISPTDGPRGAHPLAHCRAPNFHLFERMQRAAGGRVRLITLAPELPGAADFIRSVTASGVKVALGHTEADADAIRAAVDAGASLSTHLGNGCHDRLQRHHNILWEQLADDRLVASLIADGHHLPPAALRTFIRAKGLARVVLVSDAVQHAGLPIGRYSFAGKDVEVGADGAVRLAGEPRLAGAGLMLLDGVEHLVRALGMSFRDAWLAASLRPRFWLGIPASGALANTDPAQAEGGHEPSVSAASATFATAVPCPDPAGGAIGTGDADRLSLAQLPGGDAVRLGVSPTTGRLIVLETMVGGRTVHRAEATA